jgi:hypothetical protein
MQDIEQKIDLLLARQITKTRFATITVPVNDKGIPLGQGKCKAVVLHLNYYVLNNSDVFQNTDFNGSGIYYGDSNQQTCELLFNTTSQNAGGINTRSSNIIFCNDLSEVWVRGKISDGGEPAGYQLEVIIYE